MSDEPTLVIEPLPPLQLPLVNRFYRDCRYSAKAGRGELVYVARGQGRMLAAVRLVPQVDNHLFLRSFCVAPEQRRRTIGRQLLEALVPVLHGYRCYCFPFRYLQDFYGRIGFVAAQPHTQPDFIAGPYRRYCRQGRDIVIMVRS
ncbi:GNAT family N-acetyltransferase [Exilibacterium tricleocarpae]|uniref:GNAT family N-acetyltransferase n=1 Tax=Exilibacterium tricleocarpae TaxID=2591008 RepID=UPI0015D328FC|nr:GNAT family N-acetyltransferase [Exilibacterium tricleocarpae]